MTLLHYVWTVGETDFKAAYAFLSEIELWTLVRQFTLRAHAPTDTLRRSTASHTATAG